MSCVVRGIIAVIIIIAEILISGIISVIAREKSETPGQLGILFPVKLFISGGGFDLQRFSF